MEYVVWIVVAAVAAYLAYKHVPAFRAKADAVKDAVETEIKK
jgi:nitrate/nitrite transporter NarK